MAWVWQRPVEGLFWGGQFDYLASEPVSSSDYLSDDPLPIVTGKPIIRSRTSLKRFRKLHCPPIDSNPTIDRVWQDIILRFVPADRVQFYPVRLIARGEICDDYSWVIPFDRVRCIDLKRSDIGENGKVTSLKDPTLTLVFNVRKYVHKPGCLGGKHLARDEQDSIHLIISDELKEALAATGEDSMFFRPEDTPTIANLRLDRV
jgi:hypothetical protein